MRVTQLFAFIVVAAASSASARPEETGDRVLVGASHARDRPRGDHDWVRLASPTPTKWGTEYIILGRDLGWFRTLRFEAVSGTVMLRRVRIISRGHSIGPFRVETKLDARHPVAYVDLGAPTLIDQIVVTTDRRPAGAYAIDGTSSTVTGAPRVASR